VETDDEELYVPDDVLGEASAARYQMLSKKSKLRCQEELEKIKKIMREWKPVSERQWAKNDERKWSERERNFHPLVTMDKESLSREVSNKNFIQWIRLKLMKEFKKRHSIMLFSEILIVCFW
jgi:hypothetical protein